MRVMAAALLLNGDECKSQADVLQPPGCSVKRIGTCRPNAPFAELLCLSKSSVAEEYYAERSGNRWISE